MLVEGVVIAAGASALNIDIPAAAISGALTFDGGAAIASENDDEVAVWLRNRATGSLVFIEEIDFDSWDGSEFPVRSYNFRDDRVIDLDVIPGTYDILYRRFWSTGDEERDFGDEADGSYPYGSHVLQQCVALP
ncbi:MAG: hypothetical protein AB8I08_22775 [Sandaracinaceae bacterium]